MAIHISSWSLGDVCGGHLASLEKHHRNTINIRKQHETAFDKLVKPVIKEVELQIWQHNFDAIFPVAQSTKMGKIMRVLAERNGGGIPVIACNACPTVTSVDSVCPSIQAFVHLEYLRIFISLFCPPLHTPVLMGVSCPNFWNRQLLRLILYVVVCPSQ